MFIREGLVDKMPLLGPGGLGFSICLLCIRLGQGLLLVLFILGISPWPSKSG